MPPNLFFKEKIMKIDSKTGERVSPEEEKKRRKATAKKEK